MDKRIRIRRRPARCLGNTPKLLLACLLLLISTFSHAKLVTAKGLSEVEEGELVAARKVALESAKREAVEQVMGTFIRARTDVKNFMLASDQIFSNTSGQINQYRIVEDGVNDDGVYQVVIEADIDVNLMLTSVNDIQASFGWLKKPRFSLLINDASNNPAMSSHTRGFLTKQMLKEGFEIFDDSQAVYAGFIIDMLVTTNTVQSDYQGMTIDSNEMVMNVTVRRAGDERVIATAVESANKAGTNTNRVLTDLSEKLIKKTWRDVRKQTLRFWKREQLTATTIVFEIDGVYELTEANTLKSVIQEIAPAIQSIELNTLEAGKANFVVTYKGWAEQMYEELVASQIQKRHKVELTSVKGNKITASFG